MFRKKKKENKTLWRAWKFNLRWFTVEAARVRFLVRSNVLWDWIKQIFLPFFYLLPFLKRKKKYLFTLRGLNFAVFAVFIKKFISTRNRLKWGQPRNLIHAKFNFWTAFFSRFLKGLHEEKNTSSNTLYTSTVLTKKNSNISWIWCFWNWVWGFFRRLFVCRYCPRFFLMLYSLLLSPQRKVD